MASFSTSWLHIMVEDHMDARHAVQCAGQFVGIMELSAPEEVALYSR